jgi:hypothetical protein
MCEGFCKLAVRQTHGSNESTTLFFRYYIRAAGGCSFLRNQGLSLFSASGNFFAPTAISSLQNSDK